MPASRYDLAIVGNSLAARMAAALLAKHGKRLIRFSAPLCQDPWLNSSLFVEKMLGILGARACFAPYPPFQVLSSQARVTIQPEPPLALELAREFGSAGATVGERLGELERTGKRLEELLWEHGGLPLAGMGETARWRWLCLRRKMPLAELAAPLADRLQNLPEPAGEWLRDLFQGLSLQPLEALTVADGALLWAHACRPEGIAADELQQLLDKRFEQFHGIEAQLDTLELLEHQHGHWQGTLHGGGQFRAEHLILADLGHDFAGRRYPLPPELPPPNRHFVTSALDGQLSPLLMRRVIAGGPLPMRMALTTSASGLAGQVTTRTAVEASQLRHQLEPLLPFARYTLAVHAHDRIQVSPGGSTSRPLPLFQLPVRLGSHLWCADEARLLPHLGLGGAALLAWTMVRQLDPTVIVRNG